MSARELTPHLKPVRFSRLKLMGQSAAHYLGQFEEEREDNESFRFGRLVHSVMLGGKFAIYEKARRGKAWKAFKAANEGADIVTRAEHTRAVKVAARATAKVQAIRAADPSIPDILAGDHEKEIAWMNEGRACGARIDVLGSDFVTELKTTTSAEPAWFTRNGSRLAYHAQVAWYLTGARMAFPREFKRAFIVAVEVRHPYETTVFEVTQPTLDLGARLWRSWWERLMVCEASDEWPGYAQSIVPFDIQPEVELDYGD